MDVQVPIAYAYRQDLTLTGTALTTPALGSLGDHAYFGVTVNLAPRTTIDGHLTLAYYVGLITGSPPPGIGPREDDVTDLGGSIPQSLKDYITHLLTKDSPSDYLRFVLMKGGAAVDPSFYTFDYSAWKLNLKWGGLLYNEQYYIAIYADMGEFASLAADGRGRAQAPSPYYVPAGSNLPPPAP
jgi:hypothetical protein